MSIRSRRRGFDIELNGDSEGFVELDSVREALHRVLRMEWGQWHADVGHVLFSVAAEETEIVARGASHDSRACGAARIPNRRSLGAVQARRRDRVLRNSKDEGSVHVVRGVQGAHHCNYAHERRRSHDHIQAPRQAQFEACLVHHLLAIRSVRLGIHFQRSRCQAHPRHLRTRVHEALALSQWDHRYPRGKEVNHRRVLPCRARLHSHRWFQVLNHFIQPRLII